MFVEVLVIDPWFEIAKNRLRLYQFSITEEDSISELLKVLNKKNNFRCTKTNFYNQSTSSPKSVHFVFQLVSTTSKKGDMLPLLPIENTRLFVKFYDEDFPPFTAITLDKRGEAVETVN